MSTKDVFGQANRVQLSSSISAYKSIVGRRRRRSIHLKISLEEEVSDVVEAPFPRLF